MKRIPQNLRHAALLAALCVPLMTIAQTKEVDPKADDVLRAMTTYMAGLKHFSVKAESTVEVVTTDGDGHWRIEGWTDIDKAKACT